MRACPERVSSMFVPRPRAPTGAARVFDPARRLREMRIIDYEYARNGTANIFMLSAPLEGRRESAS